MSFVEMRGLVFLGKHLTDSLVRIHGQRSSQCADRSEGVGGLGAQESHQRPTQTKALAVSCKEIGQGWLQCLYHQCQWAWRVNWNEKKLGFSCESFQKRGFNCKLILNHGKYLYYFIFPESCHSKATPRTFIDAIGIGWKSEPSAATSIFLFSGVCSNLANRTEPSFD